MAPGPEPLLSGSLVSVQSVRPPQGAVLTVGQGFAYARISYRIDEEVNGDIWVMSGVSIQGDVVMTYRGHKAVPNGIGRVLQLGSVELNLGNPVAPVDTYFVVAQLVETDPSTRAWKRILAEESFPWHLRWQDPS